MNGYTKIPYKEINKIDFVYKLWNHIEIIEVIDFINNEKTLYINSNDISELTQEYDEIYKTYKWYKEMKEFKAEIKESLWYDSFEYYNTYMQIYTWF